MKKVIAWLLVFVLTAAISIGATLAYLSDTDEDVNVMTLGKVKIDQLEYERIDDETADADATVQKFHDNKPLFPGVYDHAFDFGTGDANVDWTQIGKDGYTSGIWNPEKINNEVDKMVFVKNKGDYDAYVRTVFAFEAGKYTTLDQFQSMVHLNLNETDFAWEWVETPVTIGESTYFVATATYHNVLAPGALTEISLSQIALDKTATNEDVEAFGETYQILVKSQGIQADGFEAPAAALNEGFGLVAANIPWENDNATKGGTLSSALHYLNADPTDTQITTSVTNIVFGKNAEYPEIVNSYEGYLVDVEQDVDAYAYYVENSRMTKAAATYTVYVLSDAEIYAPKDSSKLFNGMSALTAVDSTNLNTSRVENMMAMFQKCTGLTSLDVSGWDTGNVTNMKGLFINCSNLQTVTGLESLDTSSCTNMLAMFGSCAKLPNLDLSGWDVSRVMNMGQMFMQCNSMTELNLNGWDVGSCTDMSYMFYNNPKLKTIGTKDWDPSEVTTMFAMFYLCSALENVDVSGWDTSNVANFYVTFAGCTKLKELDVSGWNTGSATNMSAMFQSCESLTELDVSNWDVSNVTDMTCLFNKCYALTALDVSEWDTGNVISMNQTFNHCYTLKELDVSEWDTANVTDMGYLFMDCRSLEKLDIADWDVSKVKIFSGMFQGGGNNAFDMKLKDLDVSKWNPVSATHMNHLFYGCAQLTQLDLSGWNMPNLYTTSHMFADCSNLETIDVTGWQTGRKWLSMDAMFNDCRKVKTLDVSSFNTSGVAEFSQIFDACWALEEIKGLENWDTANGKTFDETFLSCGSLKELNLSSWDTRNVKSGHKNLNGNISQGFSKMFNGVNSLTGLIVSDKISCYGDGSVSEAGKLVFPDAVAMEGYAAKWQNVDTKETYLGKDIPEGVAAAYVPCYEYISRGATINHAIHYLNGDPQGTKITANVSGVTFGRIENYADIVNHYTGVLADQEQEMPVYAYYVPNGSNYDVYILAQDDIYAPTDCYELFYDGEAMSALKSVNLSNLNTSRTTNMARMFRNCAALTSVDLRGLDTGAVTDMSYLFYKCSELLTVNAAGIETGNVANLKAMFYECLKLKSLNLTGWDTSKVTSTRYMLIRCRGLEEIIGSGDLNFSSVTDMESMCEGLDSLTTLDVTNWGCDSAENMRQMFGWALSLETLVGIENWNVSKVTNMGTMFYLSPKIKVLDLSGWKTTSLQTMSNMLRGCTALTTVYVGDGWDMSNVTASGWMFYDCKNLVGGQGTTVGAMNSYDATYARADGGAEAPGYLTYKAAE